MARSKRSEYVENPGWASAFRREENEDPQPRYTGTGLSPEGDEVRVAVWVRRSSTGLQYLRIHIEPPFEDDDAELEDDLVEEEEPEKPRRRSRSTPNRAAPGQPKSGRRQKRAPEVEEDDDDMPF